MQPARIMRCKALAGLLFLVAAAPPATAGEALRCPRRLALLDDNAAGADQAERLKTLYVRIGCPPVTILPLPGRRGLAAFNNGDVDGEVIRLEIIETEYTRPFVRVRIPMTRVEGHFWARTAAYAGDLAAGRAGYILGLAWHEDAHDQYGGVGYHTQTDLLRAYNGGLINGFLMSNASLAQALRDGRLAARPAYAGPPIMTALLYHYLATDFAAAAAALAAAMEKEAVQNPPIR